MNPSQEEVYEYAVVDLNTELTPLARRNILDTYSLDGWGLIAVDQGFAYLRKVSD